MLEARDRVGGRAWTDCSLGAPVDLGASWLHKGADNSLAPFADQSGIRYAISDYENASAFDLDAHPVRRMPAKVVYDEIDIHKRLSDALGSAYLRHRLGRLWGRGGSGRTIDHVWREAVTGFVDPLSDAAFRLILETQYGVPLSEEALERLFVPGAARPTHEWFVTGGMQSLANSLSVGLDIRLSQSVRDIAWSPGGVSASTDTDVFEADAVILTVSVGLLKSGAIMLTPGLPKPHREALGRLSMGLLNKIALRFPAPVWPSEEEFAVLCNGPLPAIVINHQAYSGAPLIVALTGGNTARRLQTRSDAQAADALVEALRRACAVALPEPEAVRVTRWADDPLALGSYAHFRPGANLSEPRILARPIDGRVFLAGEAIIDDDDAGTVAGAWRSGRRAAAQILAAS